jgi:hypothetical protein
MSTADTRSGRTVYRLTFRIPVAMEAVEETLLLAILAVGCLHGGAAVRLDAGYAIDPGDRAVVLDAGTEIGRAVARVFIGFCTHEFGDDAFAVVRAARPRGDPPRARAPAPGPGPGRVRPRHRSPRSRPRLETP